MFFNSLGFFQIENSRQNLAFFVGNASPRTCIWAAYWHSLQIFALFWRGSTP